MKECSHSFVIFLAKLVMKDGQLLAIDQRYANSGSKIMTRTVNKLKMRSKTRKVASVGFLVNKACFRSFVNKLIISLVKIDLKFTLDELVRPSGELHDQLSEAEDLYFELKNGGLRAVERLFGHGGVLAQLQFHFSEVGYG